MADGNTLVTTPYADVSLYYVKVTSPANMGSCFAWDTIRAFYVRPQLTNSPDSICPGQTARLFGTNASYFTWTAEPDDRTLANNPDTTDHIVVQPTKTTIYTMTGYGSNDCAATPLKDTIVVIPRPQPTIEVSPAIVDVDDPTVVLRDISPYSVGTHWMFSDSSMAQGTQVQHTFEEAVGHDSVYVILMPYNELGCDTSKRFGIPVKLYTAWMPTAFTPGSDDERNTRFRMYTANVGDDAYEFFHIYIYNRRGELVYESADPAFEWDGTSDGRDMPQGSYVYVCRYRKPGLNTLSEFNGTVTLIR